MKKNILMIVSLLLITTYAFAQTRTIYGTITDEGGKGLPGVTVTVKGTVRSSISDSKGNYSILVTARDKFLVFSCNNCESKEVEIAKQTQIDVSLKIATTVIYLEQEVIYDEVFYTVETSAKVSREKAYGGAHTHAAPTGYVYADYDQYYYNTESYSAINETGFKDVNNNPLSTFSIDVDNAAYSNVRRFLNSGSLPQKDVVRIEEMLNYFSYDYAQPTGKHPFAMHAELSECPWNPKTQLLHVGLKGVEVDKSELPYSNLVFLIDVSGSMYSPNKLPLLQTAMNMLVEELRPQDRVSIVVYASRTEILLESTPASNKQKILNAINGLQAGGSTAGGQALRMAYDVAEKNFIKGGNNRIIMATDGDFNVGESSNASMERLVEDKRKSGVFITVLGFGMGNYKDDRLEIIANKGNGNYAYIDNIQEARKVMVSEFAGTLFTIAKDVKLQIEFNPERVKAYRLIGYENRRLNDEDFNNDAKDAGEMGAGHSVTALYEIIPAGSDENIPGVDPLKYQAVPSRPAPNLNSELLTIKARYKEPDGEKSVMFDLPVKGKLIAIDKTSDDFRFAAAVAEFGLLLRNSEFKSRASYDNVIKMALSAKGKDIEGYRAEFINLVRTAQNLDKLSMKD
ncbi:MAG: von Willebrand factor type A domain-containing protein [Bacteroidetes bacterium]|nr:von Willebrand factor type A domain-containing protein [Bacteroidota bacterium]